MAWFYGMLYHFECDGSFDSYPRWPIPILSGNAQGLSVNILLPTKLSSSIEQVIGKLLTITMINAKLDNKLIFLLSSTKHPSPSPLKTRENFNSQHTRKTIKSTYCNWTEMSHDPLATPPKDHQFNRQLISRASHNRVCVLTGNKKQFASHTFSL